MSKRQLPAPRLVTGGHDDLVRDLGEIDDAKAIEILALQPTLAELEEAALWTTGDGNILARSGHALSGVVAAIVEIMTGDEEEPR